jgi:glycosyltransferase involved in cell wall biosynthesis
MFYKVRALSVHHDIILHYFSYKENRNARGLEGYCREIHSYERLPFYRSLPLTTPYIIGSRNNHLLAEKLMMDDYPVLLEGIHCAGLIPSLNQKKIVLRMHNDEAEYYKRLADTEENSFKKAYHLNEARLLRKKQLLLDNGLAMACVSKTDMDVFRTIYHKTNLHFIPSFTPWQKPSNLEGSGNYCLYHGNLEISENIEMVFWLIKNVFRQSEARFIVAGKGAIKLPSAYVGQNTTIISDPTDDELDELISNAHINILPSLNNTGLKLKMIHALMNGRHCLTNDAGVAGTYFHKAVTIANTPQAYVEQIKLLMKKPFTKEMSEQRQQVAKEYNNATNASKLSALLY